MRIERRPECSRPVVSASPLGQLRGLAEHDWGPEEGEAARRAGADSDSVSQTAVMSKVGVELHWGLLQGPAKPPRSSHRLACFHSGKQTFLHSCGQARAAVRGHEKHFVMPMSVSVRGAVLVLFPVFQHVRWEAF